MAEEPADSASERSPRVIRLPGFLPDEDIGAGDVVKRVSYRVGIRPCGGCERRATALNGLLAFRGRRRTSD